VIISQNSERNEPDRRSGFMLALYLQRQSTAGEFLLVVDLKNRDSERLTCALTKGLLVHYYGKLAVACLLLTFYS
jgi:hypothetical protein